MKKFTKVLLSLALAASMVVPAAMSVSAAELTARGDNYKYSGDCGHGFLDGNLYLTNSLTAESLTDVGVKVNDKTAYWNIGWMGQKHCQLGNYNWTENEVTSTVERAWLQIGIVGADLVAGENKLEIIDKNGDTYTQTFTSAVNALGVSYSKVTADAETKTVKAEIVFNADPKLAIGTTFDGGCHDEHKTGVFTVTAYDKATGLYTLEATNFTTNQSLLELKCTSEGTYKDWYVSVTINSNKVANPQALTDANTTAVTTGATKQTLTNLNDGDFGGDASKLTNGVGDNTGKWEGGFPGSGITLTFETESAVKATYLVLYTGNDDADWNSRAPGAFKLSGSTDGTNWTVIKDVPTSGMKNNQNYAPSAFKLSGTTEYKYYKLEISATLGASYFQMGELELYTGDVTLPDALPAEGYEVKAAGVASNGTAPKAPDQGGNDTPVKPAPTGDAMVIVAVVAVVALAGVAVVSKKRTTC